ncbi:uncharacterized protein [Battus philenor]|uniref:uncharacterized protein n=1 Tax=Battus philenor TaxID=42288 RepID=UPI0035D01F6C
MCRVNSSKDSAVDFSLRRFGKLNGVMHAVCILALLLLYVEGDIQEVATPSSQLRPRNYNYHAIESKKNLNQLLGPVPTRKGPVLFPPPPSPPPATPLIVTSKPLAESIARSDLNRSAISNTLSDQSQINSVTLRPNYLNEYAPVTFPTYNTFNRYTLAPSIGSNILDQDYTLDQSPYTDIAKKSINNNFDLYPDYEVKTPFPHLQSTFSQQAGQKSLKTQQVHPVYDYQTDYQSKTQLRYKNNDVSDEVNNSENVEDNNYAFSYTVRDQKTGDDFSHSQRSSGSATNGEYRVRLPDGRLQIVSYTADENGYKADVRYDVDSDGNSVEYNSYGVQNINDNPKPTAIAVPNYNAANVQYNNYQEPTKPELYTDQSKEYYNDYSSEYNNRKYEPHQNKFAALFDDKSNDNFDYKQDYITSTVKPNYLQLRDVLEKALPNVQPTFNYYQNHDTTENIVVIGGSKNKLPSENPVNDLISVTPRSYLASTISSLRDRVSYKPILSDSFINRINKYLSFK